MEGEASKEASLMGRNLSEVPCFRETFLYSITSGLGSGLVNFMLTSRVQRSVQVGLGVYTCMTLGYWSYCRYNYSQQKFSMGQLQVAMQKQALLEGTEVEKKIKG
ncbi:cytochrome c oxidase assembly protein COX20, mitochondrial-like [Penaeus chinensis]|uniref:cytochrome c oxidase assembly protein COX20, mitochondrial-like n=1 Tax=Penaeus chinensis TaxID=139456 RepID=UPI001FB6043C|nr:cytochrome c oxidase assembly protein COX20, mitochondrial-like [Penaeus chinensis]